MLPNAPGLATETTLTPGSNRASSRKFRPLSGKLSTCTRLTSPPTCESVRFRLELSPFTSMRSRTSPGFRTKFSVLSSPTSSVCTCTVVAKLGAATAISYFPGARASTRYCPSVWVSVVRTKPVWLSLAVTKARAIGAPVASVTVPLTADKGTWAATLRLKIEITARPSGESQG